MAFLLPFFEYDVFVSYSHGVQSPSADAPIKEWTFDLIRKLESDIRAVDIEFDNLHFWRDEKIDPSIQLSDEIRAKVKCSGILLIIMSPRYLASTWCQAELEWLHDRERDQGRFFIVRATEVIKTSSSRASLERGAGKGAGERYPRGIVPVGWATPMSRLDAQYTSLQAASGKSATDATAEAAGCCSITGDITLHRR